MAPLGALWLLYERVYGWLHGLEDLAAGDRPHLRTVLGRYRWASITLPDGTRLRRGDHVLFLHLHNQSLATVGRQAGSPRLAGLALRRGLRASLETLANRSAIDPRFADVRAIGAVTNLWHGARRLGFAVYPMPHPWRARLVAAYQRRLRSRFCLPSVGARRTPHAGGRGEARFIWLSTAALREHYGAPAETRRRSERVTVERAPARPVLGHASAWPGSSVR